MTSTYEKHLVIAGTGRAGTTTLVKWLRAHGQDVGIPSAIDGRSGSGLEIPGAVVQEYLDPERPVRDGPYVLKDPMFWSYCHQCDPERIRALLIPVRVLHDAAKSRVRLEAARREAVASSTPGGMVHSTSVHVQEQQLAYGFHRLVQWASYHNVETIFLGFNQLTGPKFENYLMEKLEGCMITKNTPTT